MTPQDRTRLRAAIDRRVRELVADDEPACRGCGRPRSSRTTGCTTCSDRHRNWRRRGRRPDYLPA